ncbi:MAG: hypothetical protein D6691_01185 [Candidatus Hydrogenedentota bacterium]|jgi:hypothetical protein|nr:MAG: hypothetical protein D6691_01185 [Candidatus Hydrogenedentota bacterium]
MVEVIVVWQRILGRTGLGRFTKEWAVVMEWLYSSLRSRGFAGKANKEFNLDKFFLNLGVMLG